MIKCLVISKSDWNNLAGNFASGDLWPLTPKRRVVVKVKKQVYKPFPLFLLVWSLVLLGCGVEGAAMFFLPLNKVSPLLVVFLSGLAFRSCRSVTFRFQIRRFFCAAGYLFGCLSWWWLGSVGGIEGVSQEAFKKLFSLGLPARYVELVILFAAGSYAGHLWREKETIEWIVRKLQR